MTVMPRVVVRGSNFCVVPDVAYKYPGAITVSRGDLEQSMYILIGVEVVWQDTIRIQSLILRRVEQPIV